MKPFDLQCLIRYRHELHQHPEVSGQEEETSARIVAWLSQYEPDQVITGLGGFGLAAIYKGVETGPSILFRAELDALPVAEAGLFSHRSLKPGVAHVCGHDGHMAILLGLAQQFHRRKPRRGKVILLFQPAEETGAGALKVLSDPVFMAFRPDYVFAIHNLPGFLKHEVVIRKGCFAAASAGLIIHLTGQPSHASEPEKGRNPAIAVASLITHLDSLVKNTSHLTDFALITIIHVQLGSPAFGTSPGEATVMATLRAFAENDIGILLHQAEKAAHDIANRHRLKVRIIVTEPFPFTMNDADAAECVRQAAGNLNLKINEPDTPFRWSEDFGHFTSRFRGAMIGLGAGIHQPPLHHSAYDFPDDIIPTGVALLIKISEMLNG